MPKITVAMAVYNDAQYLNEAIDSILNQSFNDFELLIINDGSTDETPELIESYNDKRIKSIHFNSNKGRPFARNEALIHANSQYLAWMDGDDISTHNRLELQVNFMDKNPDIALCGGQMQCFGESNHLVKLKNSKEAVKAGIIWHSSTINGTNCMCLERVREHGLHLQEELLRVEDYAFLAELLLSTPLQAVNIPHILLNCRYFYRPTTPVYHAKAAKYALRALSLPHDELSCYKHTILSIGPHVSLPQVSTTDVLFWADEVYNAVLKRRDIDMHQFLRVTHAKIETFLRSTSDSQHALRKYAALPLGKTHNLNRLF